MFVVFFLIAAYCGLQGIFISNNAQSAIHQILAENYLGTAAVMTAAGVIDIWAHIIGGRARRLENALDVLPKRIARALAAELDDRDRVSSDRDDRRAPEWRD